MRSYPSLLDPVDMAHDNAHKILDVYAHFEKQPGEALVSNHFLGVGRLRRWRASDLQEGIEEAHRNGWVEKAHPGWRLTELGYAEFAKPS